MMMRMASPPALIRRKRKHADHSSNPPISRSPAKKSSVATIMLDQEQSNEKRPRRNCQQQSQPYFRANQKHRSKPQRAKRDDRHHEFRQTATRDSSAEPVERFDQGLPVHGVGRGKKLAFRGRCLAGNARLCLGGNERVFLNLARARRTGGGGLLTIQMVSAFH